MSGGFFEYRDYMLGDFADQIEHIIKTNLSNEKDEWGQIKGKHYPPEVIEEFKSAVKHLRVTQIYVHRIDYLLSGDDGEDDFLSQLKEDMDELVNLRSTR